MPSGTDYGFALPRAGSDGLWKYAPCISHRGGSEPIQPQPRLHEREVAEIAKRLDDGDSLKKSSASFATFCSSFLDSSKFLRIVAQNGSMRRARRGCTSEAQVLCEKTWFLRGVRANI
jgi:hypothetical protein